MINKFLSEPENNGFFQAIALTDFYGFAKISTNGDIIMCSPGFSHITVYLLRELIGENIYNLYAPSDRKYIRFENLIASSDNKQQIVNEVSLYRKDTTQCYVKMIYNPLTDKNGIVLGYAVEVFNISNEKILQKENNDLKEKLNQKAELLKSKNKELEEFSRYLSSSFSIPVQKNDNDINL